MAIEQLTPPEVQTALSRDATVVFLDVRTEAEFQAGHPAGAINVPVVFFPPAGGRPAPNPHFLTVVEANVAKDAHVILGCQAGVRSQHAAELMQQAGYTNLTNMLGGFGGGQDHLGRVVPGWQAEGLPVSTENGDGVSYASLSEKGGREGSFDRKETDRETG